MVGARMVITAETAEWALAAGRSVTGFATSIIGCKCEAGIETTLAPDDTPDGRPGISVLLFAMNEEGLGKRLVERIGQCVMTCPSTACYNGLATDKEAVVGGQLRFFGDKFQISKLIEGRRMWRVPVMDGEFLVDDRFGVQPAVGGGNFLMLGRDHRSTLAAAAAAVAAMNGTAGAILPFPAAWCGAAASQACVQVLHVTNDAYCPTSVPSPRALTFLTVSARCSRS
jgi:formylmethanofuran--tetrahydromethanopterin N-formyltransferase